VAGVNLSATSLLFASFHCLLLTGRMKPDRRASLTQNPPVRIDSHREWANSSNNAIAIANFSTRNFGAPFFIGAI
jgi:hypothetical protein